MLFSKTSPRTGIVNTRDIPCTPEQVAAWTFGALIQDAMPNVSAEDREFLMTGYTPEDWDAMFSDEDHYEETDSEEPWDGFNSDAEADADVLRNAGWGTDEDYGYFGNDEF